MPTTNSVMYSTEASNCPRSHYELTRSRPDTDSLHSNQVGKCAHKAAESMMGTLYNSQQV